MPSSLSKHAVSDELGDLLQMINLILYIQRELNTIRIVQAGMNTDFNRSTMCRLDRFQCRINKQIQPTRDEVEVIKDSIQRVLQQSLEFIRREVLNIDTNLKDIELSIASILHRIETQTLRMDNQKRECEETKKRICLLEKILSPKCYQMEEGVFDCCITNFRAKCDQNLCITCPFTTSKYGYKFLFSVYPYGYHAGSDTHLSVKIAVMRGTFNALLPWPFRHSFTIRLISQLHNGDCIEGVISAPSFNKPTNVNQSQGFDHFIDLTLLFDENRGYLVNDTLVFHISVDTIDLADACKTVDVENGCKNLHPLVAQATN